MRMGRMDGAGPLLIGIRVDSNETVGGGHLSRCLTVAKALKVRRATPLFFTTGTETREQIEAAGFQAILLNGRFDAPDRELAEWIGRIEVGNLPLILADSYYFTAPYLEALRRVTAVASFDDLQTMRVPCDIVINYLPDPPMDWYGRYEGTGTRLLLGGEYIPLGPEYGDRPARAIRPDCRRVLITTGAADPCHVAERLAKILPEALDQEGFPQGLAVDFVFGRFSAPGEEVRRLAAVRSQINILREPADLAARMGSADLAVTAAGTMLFEAAACGTPAVVYTVADNQMANARGFSRLCGLPWVGDFRGEDAGERVARKTW